MSTGNPLISTAKNALIVYLFLPKANQNNFLFNFRERLIHLLAVRPYKKPELYAKIKSGKYCEKLTEG